MVKIQRGIACFSFIYNCIYNCRTRLHNVYCDRASPEFALAAPGRKPRDA
jgi:hypothetical protein